MAQALRQNSAIMLLAGLIRRHRPVLAIVAMLSLAGLGFAALHHLLAEVHLHDVRKSLDLIPSWRLGAAVGLTLLSYFILTFYDVIALRILGKPQSYQTAALASFTSYTLSHNLGLALLTGGSARYRIYSAKGLESGDIMRVIAIAGVTFWIGVFAMASLSLVIQPAGFPIQGVTIPGEFQRAIGAAALTALLGLLLVVPRPKRPIRIWRWHIPLPQRKHALAQLIIAALDLTAASAALYVLIPGLGLENFPTFFLAYTLAIIIALFSHVPGGVGVFEAMMIVALPDVDTPSLLAALIAYRFIYYLLPLLVAGVLLAVHEHKQWKRPVAIVLDSSRAVAASLAPTVLAILTFLGGVLLLISGALPAVPARLHMLLAIIPLPFAEASHIAGSLAGTALLLVAPGLYQRQDAAFIFARALLIAGAAFSLIKGIDYEEAIILAIIAALLQWTRHAFYRHTAFTRQSFSPSWLVAVGVAICLSLWIGLFAYKHVAYQNELWWQFAWNGDAPRFLRSAFAASLLLVAVAVMHLLRPESQKAIGQDSEIPDLTLALAASDRTDAMLALTGDKRFLSSPDGTAFIMYQVQGRSWIVMGDPVGPSTEWADLMWQIRELSDRAQGRLLFYQMTTEALPIAIDMGLQLIKYGEEAKVDLAKFSLDGPDAKALRYAERRASREGACFEVVPANQVASILPELQTISDCWLQAKGNTEKAFSVGHFEANYLSGFDCALVRWNGKIVAFANIWATENHKELSVDLMRHGDSLPYGTMDFLFTHLMKWGQQKGYRWFSLGLAPLSGIEVRRSAPLWARIGHGLYQHGESFYGFEGLRAYKAKFSPIWEPRYIAAPHGTGLVRALVDLQALIGGGRRSVAGRKMTAQEPISPVPGPSTSRNSRDLMRAAHKRV